MEGDRRVGVAVDFSACSKKALSWAVDNVVRDGDHLILIYVHPEAPYEDGQMQLWEATGSRVGCPLATVLLGRHLVSIDLDVCPLLAAGIWFSC